MQGPGDRKHTSAGPARQNSRGCVRHPAETGHPVGPVEGMQQKAEANGPQGAAAGGEAGVPQKEGSAHRWGGGAAQNTTGGPAVAVDGPHPVHGKPLK